ncbi:MAG: hypothetical protein AUJ47_01750 [Candidatus Marinimicrobia bacterium CG1_02_48_14]|nr:MAG: hypothetical protein AUJ47_01750 [Candidatus Marinimicrobia bacterium CG1_02_48_14]
MTPLQDPKSALRLSHLARELAKGRFQIGLLMWSTIVLAALMLMAWVESWRYLAPLVRTIFDTSIGIAGGGTLVLLIVWYYLLRDQKLTSTQPPVLARAVLGSNSDVRDAILNAVQLSQQIQSNQLTGSSTALAEAAIQQGANRAAALPADLLYPEAMIQIWRKRLVTVLIILLLVYAVNFDGMNGAFLRLFTPGVTYPYPLPVSLAIDTDQQEVLAGDTILVTGQIRGRQFSSVTLVQQSRDEQKFYSVPVKHGEFRVTLPHVEHTFKLLATIQNGRFWEPWQTQQSDTLHITVINRPVVQQLTVKIRPPAYTHLPGSVYSRDILEINAMRGSKISLEGLVSKPVKSAQLVFASGKKQDLIVTSQQVTGKFTLMENGVFWIQVMDDEGVSNLNPLKYPVYAMSDAPPLAKVLVPAQDVLLSDAFLLPLKLKLDDDFGFSKLTLNYQIRHPDYLMPDTSRYSLRIALPQESEKTLEINYNWAMDDLSLSPEDGVDYWFTVWDNDAVSGPKSAQTRIWSARLPSVSEMFQQVNQTNEEVKTQTEDVLDAVKEIKEKVDELALEVTKNPKMSWEQQQEARQSMEQMQQTEQKLKDISEKLDKMIQSAKEQNLFDKETLDKYSELQELFQDLLSPELKAAMEKLQQAMQDQNPQQIQQAMQDFQASMENFKQSVERTLEIFKRVQIEQKLDELSQRLTDLAERQSELVQDLESKDAGKQMDSAVKEQKISDEFEAAKQTAQDLNNLLQDQQELDPQMGAEFQQAMEQSQTSENLQQSLQQMKNSQMQSAQQPAQRAQQSLQQLAQQAAAMQSQMQQQMMDEVVSAFRKIMMKTLNLSQMQESLEDQTRDVAQHSSQIGEMADQQQALKEGLKQIAADMSGLANQTFAVSPKLGQTLGQSQTQMENAIERMESRSPAQAAQAQAKAREALNMTAEQLASAMQNLMQGGQSSGFEQYMQQLQQMAGQQQGLNQQTMMGMGNMSMMQQLAERQMQLKKNLQNIQEGMGDDPRMMGDLGKIGQEMEEVAKAMRQSKPRRDLMEKQERILSRLLDAQRSANQRDFSKKRTSKTGEDQSFWTGPNGLPADLGEARNVIYEELLYSLKQSYSREDQALIRAYFEALSDQMNQSDQQGVQK